MSTAAASVLKAVATALESDAALQAALGATVGDPHVFNPRKPEGDDARRYVVLRETGEGDASSFDADGNAGVLRLHLWIDPDVVLPGETAPLGAEDVYAHVERILNCRPIPLAGHRLHVGTTDYSKVLDDLSGKEHLVVAYRTLTEATA